MNERVLIPIVVGNKVLSEGSDGVGQSVDPATGQVVADFARAGEVEVEMAVAAARLFRGWMDMLLGLVALIGCLAAAFPLLLLGWPAFIVRSALLFVAASLLASAGVHIWLAASLGGAGRRPRG